MKKILTVLLVACVVFACTKDETTEVSNDTSFDFSKNLSVYDNTSDGLYKGIFSTNGSEYRGTIVIKVKDGQSIATLALVNERNVELIGTSTDDGILFTGASAAFKFAVEADGSNPIVSEVTLKGMESTIIVAKETSRAAVTPISGTLDCDDCAAHPLLVTGPTGTFSLLFVGDGSGDDIVTSMVDVGVMVSTPGTQSGCAGVDPTDCAVAGGAVIGGNTIGWMGTHSYLTASDCSEASGTWSLDSTHGAFTGTWVSDISCTSTCAGDGAFAGDNLGYDIDGPVDTTTADCLTTLNLSAATVPAGLGVIGTDVDITSVDMDISHTFDGDLQITLISPIGTELTLWDDGGSEAGDDFTGTVFMDGGADILLDVPPFTGTYAPVGGTFAAAFAGESSEGAWTVRLCDIFGGDTGTFNDYNITFTCSGARSTTVIAGDTKPRPVIVRKTQADKDEYIRLHPNEK